MYCIIVKKAPYALFTIIIIKFHSEVQIESPTCPHCGNGDKTAEHLLLLCPKSAAERQHYLGHLIEITDVLDICLHI